VVTAARQHDEVTSEGDVLTVSEAAEFLKIGRTQLYDAIARGEIPHRRIGRSIRLSRMALAAWLAAPAKKEA